MTIEEKFIRGAVKNYFDLDLKNWSAMDSAPSYYFDSKLYHFEGAGSAGRASNEGQALCIGAVHRVEGRGA